MRRPDASVFALAFAVALVGSITLTYLQTSAPSMTVATVEVPLGRLASGSAVGTNATNGTVSVVGAIIIAATENVWYLNNTNASGVYYVKLVETSASGLSGATTINIGIDNGTSTDQIKVANGALTQTSGPYVLLPASSTNRIYVTTLVSALYGTGVITLDVYVADDAGESAYYTARAQVTVT